ncbi:hypothetical protein D9619_008639 [Psilocybe cf. subviscida]|uniref:Transcription factor CBF/NF-Y/archaeal histone domain-containing protein n=1 Tax=Psilocybe cf. subviscida TaxID=2480587 RepID=A0A8H5BC10_9AGAR|nr:hypothetical protein D9619_008639 [Psilocybe cf. subviscida]
MKNKNKQTKFPVARIKKIMQKDEEVGKVAQATPIVISKALELFLGMIVEASSKVTTERGSKKVEPYHLKHAVETEPLLDFLTEIVDGIPDPSAGGTINFESENTDGRKKRGKGKRGAAAAAGPSDPTAPAAPKRRRKKKEEADAPMPSSDAAPSKSTPEEDVDMAQEDDDYDEDEDTKPAYRPRSPSED